MNREETCNTQGILYDVRKEGANGILDVNFQEEGAAFLGILREHFPGDILRLEEAMKTPTRTTVARNGENDYIGSAIDAYAVYDHVAEGDKLACIRRMHRNISKALEAKEYDALNKYVQRI